MNIRSYSARSVWLFGFVYISLSSIIFQKLVLPHLPGLHAGFGLLKNDAFFYHQSAQLLAEHIHEQGWSAWSLWSAETRTTGNVAILTALYALFSSDPAWIIPINAVLHATSAVLLMRIAQEIWPGRTGDIAGLMAAALFILFPSALSWYSQPLKDTYVIAGMLLIVYVWGRVVKEGKQWRELLVPFCQLWVGVLLVLLVKPYFLKLLLVMSGLISIALALRLIWSKRQTLPVVIFFLLSCIGIAALNHAIKPYVLVETSGESYAAKFAGEKAGGWTWHKAEWLPEALENYVEISARTRVGMIRFNQEVGAGSLIDADEQPQSTAEAIMYLPRALQIGMFAPFPNT